MNLHAFHEAFKEDGHQNHLDHESECGGDVEMRRVVKPGDGGGNHGEE